MSSPSKENEEPSSTSTSVNDGVNRSCGESSSAETQRPPAKRRLSSTVIEISDTDSDDSDVCAVNSYQASADEVKRIRGADYSSSSSSSSDYSSDSESPWEDDSVLVEDENITSKPVKAQLNPRANRMDEPKLNPALKAQELKERLTTHWNELKDYKSNELTLTCEPFRVCLLHNVLDNPEIINNIVDDMNTLDWSRKKMDLYEFHQTTDLASLTWQRSIRGIHELLKTEVMSWVSEVTGLELTSVSASCSLYGPGDHLLVHDDLLADRRVAFILYLSPWAPRAQASRLENGNGSGDHDHTGAGAQCKSSQDPYSWCAPMGGALELLARDAAGPSHVVRRVYPRNNMLAFFQVGLDSFHQVGEVLTLELPRLSINGWFHGPAPAAPPPDGDLPPPDPPLPLHNDVVLLNQWVEATYMSPRSRGQIQAQMERESEVCLRDLLLPDRYRQLLDELREPDVEWERAGPAHQRRYERVTRAWLRRGGRGARPAAAVRQPGLRAAACRLQRPGARLLLAPGAAALGARRLHAAAPAGAVPGGAAGGGAVPGRAGAAVRRRHGLRGARGGRGRAGGPPAHQQRPQPRLLRRRRRLLHQVRLAPHHERGRQVLHPDLLVLRVTSVRTAERGRSGDVPGDSILCL